ncbi:MAG TPA: nucleotidyltransferase [Myxococcales bacterium]
MSLLNSNRVRYVVVGAHALGAHGQPRFTGDLDVLVEPTHLNARRVLAALKAFGFGKVGIKLSDLETPGMVFRLGYPPVGIDLLTRISGVSFAKAWEHRTRAVMGGQKVHVLSLADYVRNKRAAGRPKDLLDLELLGKTRAPAKRREPGKKR